MNELRVASARGHQTPPPALNLLVGSSAEEFDLVNGRWFEELSRPQNISVAQLHHINDEGVSGCVFGSISPVSAH